jgi:tetratricopeptide (TPR) repeat protein
MHAVLGEYGHALRHGEEALAVAKDLDYPLLEASAADTLASVFFALEEYGESEARYLAAIACAQNNGLKLNNAISQANLGELYFFQQRWRDCTKAVTEALGIASEINQRETYLKASAYKRSILSDSSEFPAAKQKLNQILSESKDFGDPRYITLASRLLGKLLLEFGTDAADKKKAVEILESGFAIAAEKEIAVEKKLISKLLGIQ